MESIMPKSMTGFGRGESAQYDRRFKVEIKAVNHRYSDFTIKMPRFLNSLEDRIRRRLAEDIARGKVDVWIQFESFAQKDVKVNLNLNIADAFVEALAGLSNRYEFGKLSAIPTLELLAKNPDVMTLDRFDSTLSTESDMLEIWETLSQALDMALTQFNQMRSTEGNAAVADIKNKRDIAQHLIDQITERAPLALEAQELRLRERLDEILQRLDQKPDETRLLSEIAILADKSCISEELTRLQSHFSQLSAMLKEDDAIGRKLDFLVQELNREANTIGSKSADIGITTLAVELKSIIEKMREQVQNIE